MATIRINKSDDYSVISNLHLRDNQLSLKAKGMLSLLLALPKDFQFSYKNLNKLCLEKEDTIKSTMKELKQYGYLVITKVLPNETQSGRYEYVYDIFEKKQEVGKQEVEKQGVVFPPLVLENAIPYKKNNIYNIYKKDIYKEKIKEIYKEKRKEKISAFIDDCKYIINYLNFKTGRHFSYMNTQTQDLLQSIVNAGFNVADIVCVIDKKTKEWENTKFAKFLRPITLFSDKFESYLNQNENETFESNKAKTKNEYSQRGYTQEKLKNIFGDEE